MKKSYDTPHGLQTIPEIGLRNHVINDGFERQMGFVQLDELEGAHVHRHGRSSSTTR